MVKGDIYGAVLDYFHRGMMFFPLNITAVTLIPKVENASSVKDYRLISFCSVVYKIISKILTSRLSKVVFSLVNKAQSGFIPGNSLLIMFYLHLILLKDITERILVLDAWLRWIWRKPMILLNGALLSISYTRWAFLLSLLDGLWGVLLRYLILF